MKVGRNDPCPCGSGKKYKHCCLERDRREEMEERNEARKAEEEFVDASVARIQEALNAEEARLGRDLTDNEMFAVTQKMMYAIEAEELGSDAEVYGKRFGLSTEILDNWVPEERPEKLEHYKGIVFETPEDLTNCPVMRYLEVIIDEVQQAGGRLKMTAKGNLPLKVVRRCAEVTKEFKDTALSMGDFASQVFVGPSEERFGPLMICRATAMLCGILEMDNGCLKLSDPAVEMYREEGLSVFYLPMLQANILRPKSNLAGSGDQKLDLATLTMFRFWLFIAWRLSVHGDFMQAVQDIDDLMPNALKRLLLMFITDAGAETEDEAEDAFFDMYNACLVSYAIEILMLWGFAKADDDAFFGGTGKMELLPNFAQTFKFTV